MSPLRVGDYSEPGVLKARAEPSSETPVGHPKKRYSKQIMGEAGEIVPSGKKISKIADWYLSLTALFYILAGATPVFFLGLIFVSIGSYLGFIPLRAIQLSFSGFPDGIPKFQWLLPVLSVTAFIFGIVALVALMRINKSPRYIFVWYSLAAISWIILIDNVIVTATSGHPFPLILMVFVHPILMTISVFKVRKATKAN